MSDDLKDILRRLERIEQHLCLGHETRGGRPGWSGPPQGRQPAWGPPGWGPPMNQSGCHFDEKRVVDTIVGMVTQRLEEVLRLIPKVLEHEREQKR